MKIKPFITLVFLCAVILAVSISAQAQLSETAAWASTLRYRIVPNVTYITANNFDAKLDIYTPQGVAAPVPTLIYIHGGGWVGGNKEGAILNILPYLEMGWAVVNVQYRLARISLAPAAVEDCRCALRWVIRNAKEYNFDVNKLVVTGHSAGGHLSLTTGMLPASAGLDRECYGTEDLKVAAIINWFGITDVNDLLEGPNLKSYAVQWLSSLPNREDVAKRVSPIHYVRAGLPPILTIHGDADPTVPYAHGVKLHEALTKAGVPNRLLTIPGGKHGGFTKEESLKIFAAIQEFLKKQGITQ
ncbi:MAG: alpha/beta hydrolase [Acidobacteria bacterium]|nr:alpha/beta hydrolase [Acidobacteriota bacterium]